MDNKDFMDMAFDENERSDILLTNIAANNNQSFGTAAGNDTKDKTKE